MKRLRTLAAALAAATAIPAFAIGNLADIRVYDRAAGRELPVYWRDGKAYVVGKPGNEYSVSVRNQSGDDLLAVMSVDGVNVLSGETATAKQGGYVVSTSESLDVKGWRKSLERTAAFYFTSLGDSYAARTGRPDNVGAIGVALFRKKAPEPLPYSQLAPAAPQARRAEAGAAGSMADQAAPRAMERDREDRLGTGHGRSETSPVRQVAFERATQEPAETVVIYYDRYENLLARGIIPRFAAPRPAPNPFPGFVPDPPA